MRYSLINLAKDALSLPSDWTTDLASKTKRLHAAVNFGVVLLHRECHEIGQIACPTFVSSMRAFDDHS
jgi:hypothetical protein